MGRMAEFTRLTRMNPGTKDTRRTITSTQLERIWKLARAEGMNDAATEISGVEPNPEAITMSDWYVGRNAARQVTLRMAEKERRNA